IQLTWNKPPFYKNLKGYRLSYSDENGVIQHLGVFNDTGINSFTIPNPIFGMSYQLYLTMMPLTDNLFDDLNITYRLSTWINASYGITTPGFTSAHAGTAPISYFLDNYSQEGIVIYDHLQLKVVRKLKYADRVPTFDVSANNKYLVGIPNMVKRIYFEDLIDTTKSKKIELAATFPQMTYIASISDVATGVILNNKTAVLFDYIHERKLAEIDLTNVGLYSTKITSTGNFFFCETYVGYEYFQYKNNQIIRLQNTNKQTSDKILHVDYLSGINDKLIRAFANRVEVVDCNTWTIEKQWPFPDLISDAYNLDKKSGKLLIRIKNKLILFDVLSGTKEEIATTIDSFSLENWNFLYNNGMTFWNRGKAIK
ncbi:MAG: hypothetical protein Q8905_17260, partial [Bacteroidota bacterium]|nr:hypothetical protein [Bacteroidota bacterium]